MVASTTPLAERPDLHPAHRADAMLRSALLNSVAPPLEAPLAGHLRRSGGITYPGSLAARLGALAAEEVSFAVAPAAEGLLVTVDEDGTELHLSETSLVHDPADEVWDGDDDFGNSGAAEDPEWIRTNVFRAGARQAQLQRLVSEFHRRQRQANLLVAGSIATAFVLTVGGIALLSSVFSAEPLKVRDSALLRTTSVAWQKPADLEGLPVGRMAGGESPAAAIVPAASGTAIALAPHLPSREASHVLLRGLPPGAKLSTGLRSASGGWIVKDEELPGLTVALPQASGGDYPVEVYFLGTGNVLQARRNLVLRVEPSPRAYLAGLHLKPGPSPDDLATKVAASRVSGAPAMQATLLERAKRLLAEGDIAAARLLFLHLAERGEGEAAYELARTFDGQMLAELGARGMPGDLARARDWYEKASEKGNAKAAERLKILASLTGTPSD